MHDYLLLMYDSAESAAKGTDSAWEAYIGGLVAMGRFAGGSAVGSGVSVSKASGSTSISPAISGYIRVSANNLEEAQKLLAGNPTYEHGGRVEILLLLKTSE